MDSTILIPSIVIIAVCVIFLAYYFNNKQVIVRTLKKLPTKSVGRLQTNEFSKITGKALHVKEPFLAPLSKRKCVFYKIKIEQKKRSGKNSYWSTIVNEERFQEFFLEQNGEYVIVKLTQFPKNYKCHLVVDNKTKSGTFNDPTPEFKSLLKHYNINSEGFFGFNKQLRYSEGIIEIGEEITVAGIVKWKSLKEPIEGYSYSKIAQLESSDKQKLMITDLPHVNSKRRL